MVEQKDALAPSGIFQGDAAGISTVCVGDADHNSPLGQLDLSEIE
jgi:hypothetical protein